MESYSYTNEATNRGVPARTHAIPGPCDVIGRARVVGKMRSIREQLRLSLHEAAALIGISHVTLLNAELGRSDVRSITRRKILATYANQAGHMENVGHSLRVQCEKELATV